MGHEMPGDEISARSRRDLGEISATSRRSLGAIFSLCRRCPPRCLAIYSTWRACCAPLAASLGWERRDVAEISRDSAEIAPRAASSGWERRA